MEQATQRHADLVFFVACNQVCMRLLSDGSFVYIYMCIAVTQGEL